MTCPRRAPQAGAGVEQIGVAGMGGEEAADRLAIVFVVDHVPALGEFPEAALGGAKSQRERSAGSSPTCHGTKAR